MFLFIFVLFFFSENIDKIEDRIVWGCSNMFMLWNSKKHRKTRLMRLWFTHLAIDFIELQSTYVYTHTHTRTSARNPSTPTHTYTYVLYVWYKQWTRKHRVKKIEIIRYIIAFEDSLWIYLPIYFLFLFFLFLFFFSLLFPYHTSSSFDSEMVME